MGDKRKLNIKKLNINMNKNKTNWLIAFATVIFIIFSFVMAGTWTFQTNDDIFLKSIVSGEITGTPSPYMIHSGYLWGLIISTEYKLFPSIPWYGIMLCLVHFSAMLLILYRILRKVKFKGKNIVVPIVFYVVSWVVWYQQIARIQYTVTAFIAAGVAIFWYITTERNLPLGKFLIHNIPAFLYALISINIRDTAFLGTMLLAAAIWLADFLSKKEYRKQFAFLAGIVIIVVGSVSIDTLAYSNNEWREFELYNDDRETILDYYGFPEYDSHRELYEQLDITYASFMSATQDYQLTLDDNINAGSMHTLAEVAEKEYKQTHPFKERCITAARNFVAHNLGYQDRPCSFLVILLYIIIILATIAKKNKEVLWKIAILFVSRMMTWGYLFYMGRVLGRVTQPLFMIEFLCLIGIVITLQQKLKFERWLQVAALVLSTVIIVKSGVPPIISLNQLLEAGEINRQAFRELKDYCNENIDNFYYIDTESIAQNTEAILEKQQDSYLNYIVMGSWLPNSPLITEKLKDKGIDEAESALINNEHVYYLCEKERYLTANHLFDYLKEKYGSISMSIFDELELQNGIHILVIDVG